MTTRRTAFVLGLILAALAAVAPALGDPIADKQAEAHRIVAQIDALGRRLDRASEAYDGATYRLGRIRASLRENEHELVVARRDVHIAIHRLDVALRAVYMTPSGNSTVEIILGSSSLDAAISALDAQKRISQETTQLLATVLRFKAKVLHVRQRLQRDRAAQEKLVAERAAEKARIARGLAEQHRLLSAVQSQIAALRHEEAVRQAQLAAAAAARLAVQRGEERQALSTLVVGATTEVPGSGRAPAGDGRPAVPGRRPRRGDRRAVRRLPLRLGRRGPVCVRLLRARHLRVRAGRDLAPPLRRGPVELRDVRVGRRAPAGRPRLLRGPRRTSASTSAAATTSRPRTLATS